MKSNDGARAETMRKRWASTAYHSRLLKIFGSRSHRRKLSKAGKKTWSDPEYYARMCAVRKKQAQQPGWSSWAGKATAKKCSARLKRLWKTKAWRRKLIEAGRQANLGREPWNKGLTKYTHPSLMSASKKLAGTIPDYNKYRAWYSGQYGRIRMRSSYEVKFALWCDKNQIQWQYEPKDFYVGPSKKWNGESYRPDFYLPRLGLYIEIKGRLDERQQAKYGVFQQKYPKVPWMMIQGKEQILFATSLSFREA